MFRQFPSKHWTILHNDPSIKVVVKGYLWRVWGNKSWRPKCNNLPWTDSRWMRHCLVWIIFVSCLWCNNHYWYSYTQLNHFLPPSFISNISLMLRCLTHLHQHELEHHLIIIIVKCNFYFLLTANITILKAASCVCMALAVGWTKIFRSLISKIVWHCQKIKISTSHSIIS